MSEVAYLTNLPTDICNTYGLSKVLLTRRETIRLKHLQKNLFVYNNQPNIKEYLQMMNFKSEWKYFEFLTNQLRGIYKFPREFVVTDEDGGCDNIVKQRKESFFDTLKIYKNANPLVILDFDKTITNKKFHSLYHWLFENKFNVVINSANPQKDVIKNYLHKHELEVPSVIYANKGKKAKIVNLKVLKVKNHDRPVFYIDDEQEYLLYGNLLFMLCYQYTGGGKIKINSIYEK
jgi:hypothetical protein